LKKLFQKLEAFINYFITATTFLMFVPTLCYIIYFLFICYDVEKVIAGTVTLFISIYLNKSL
jgi:hypothetical protein